MIELICGACHGHLLVETPGTTVACPHCGTHLQAPPSVPPTAAATATEVNPPPGIDLVVEEDPARAADATSDTVYLRGSQISAPPVGGFPAEKPTSATAAGTPDPAISAAVATTVVPPSEVEPSGILDLPPPENTPRVTSSSSTELPPLSAMLATDKKHPTALSTGVSRFKFLVVLSYASAMTLACLFLLYQRHNNPGTLDLPDLVPPAQITKGKKQVSIRKYLPEDRAVPPANVLRLGETRQYGALRVTPLRVTRGPLEFEYYSAEDPQIREPEGPVLKLHLRFENVSLDQEFIPLDSVLVFTKERDAKTFESFNPHNFVSALDQREERGKHAYLFNLQPNGSWLVKDQHLDQDLPPGSTLRTFVPTTPDEIAPLSGDLVWRFQFRKGYNPGSHRGVLTLIEVLFNSAEIINEQTPDDQTCNNQEV